MVVHRRNNVFSCLGPLGVTLVQCVKATGVFPSPGAGLPFLALTIAAAGLILVPIPAGRWGIVAVGAIAGGALGAGAYLALRPQTMEGFDSTGTWISLMRPVDTDELAAGVIFGALFGALLGVVVARLVRQVLDTRQTRA